MESELRQLEYDDSEIHSFLLALLEYKSLRPYKPKSMEKSGLMGNPNFFFQIESQMLCLC